MKTYKDLINEYNRQIKKEGSYKKEFKVGDPIIITTSGSVGVISKFISKDKIEYDNYGYGIDTADVKDIVYDDSAKKYPPNKSSYKKTLKNVMKNK